ncbi:MAG: hypothetical protein M0R70_02930 [Nitrospirae bacterium]|nr:hypothetical protein [Nitrospirota bacterium]
MDITIDHARETIAAIRVEIERLKQSEFTYTHPHAVLNQLEKSPNVNPCWRKYRNHLLERAEAVASDCRRNAV